MRFETGSGVLLTKPCVSAKSVVGTIGSTVIGRVGKRAYQVPACVGSKWRCQGAVSWGALLALVVVSVVLALTFVPGVLVYPEQDQAVTQSEQADLEMEQIYAQSNETLSAHVGSVREFLEGGVCIADGQFVPSEGNTSSFVGGVLAAAPNLASPLPSAIPVDTAFEGTLDDWVNLTTVRVESSASAALTIGGTGVYVSPTMILTSSALLPPDAVSVPIHDSQLGELTATVEAIDTENFGVAVLSVSAREQVHYVVSSSVSNGDAVMSTGLVDEQTLTGAGSFFTSTGILSAQAPSSSGNDQLYHTASIGSGYSGAPLTDSCGRLVGLHRGLQEQFHPGRLLGRALSVDSLNSFLAQHSLPALETDLTACQFSVPFETTD